MTPYLSKKISIMSFVAIMLVVCIHANNLTVNFLNNTETISELDVNSFTQIFISNGIARIAVPLFFIISGYLFFLNFKPSLNGFIVKYKKRFFSLFIPFLFWSISALLFLYILQLFPISKPFFANKLIRDYSFKEIIDTIFLNPVQPQLWFVADLIKFVILSPLIYCYISRISYFSIIPFLLIWFFDIHIVFLNINFMGFSFFILGSCLAIKRIKFKMDNKKIIKLLPFIWIIILLISTYMNIKQLYGADYLIRLSIFAGLPAVWFNYDSILCKNQWIENKLFTLSAYTFFLYAFHDPMLTIFKKGMLKLLGVSPYTNFLVYIITPPIIIALSIVVGSLLKKYTVWFYKIITGGRTTHLSLKKL